MRVLKSLIAMLAGCAAGTLVFIAWAAATSDGLHAYDAVAVLMIVWWVATLAIPAWVLLLLPAWLFVSPESRLWRPGWASLSGAVAATVVLAAFFVFLNVFQLRNDYGALVFLLPIAALMGAVTGLVSSLLSRSSRETKIGVTPS